ncbi:CAP domain-containing protein, partial [Eubacteriales bacterium OttesenSCG-928-M02]|nr:CAP domain-containing protein [Eubacteriales bacterium OttesenSCG-928-M02]
VPTPTPTPALQVDTAKANAIIAQVNKERADNGLPPLTVDGSLSSACVSHAKEVAQAGRAYHAANPGGCEYVEKCPASKPGGSIGATVPVHVSQFMTESITHIGAGVVTIDGYSYIVVRGRQ